MNIDDLKKSAEKITLSEDAKERIIQKCDDLAKSGNIHIKSGGDEEFTEHVFNVEHYKPRRLAKITAGLAACAVVAASVGITMKLTKDQPKSDSRSASTAGAAKDTSPEISGDPIADMLAQDFTINNDGTTDNPYTDKLSPYQREKIRELLSSPARTEIDSYDMTDCTGIKFISGNYYYFIGVKGDVMSWSRNYIALGETEPATLKGYSVSSDAEGNTKVREANGQRVSPDTNADAELPKKLRKYYKLSANIEADLRAIINMPLENIIGYDFFAENFNDISENERNEIRSYIHGLELKKVPSVDAEFGDLSANITLNYEEENLKYKLDIFGSCLSFSVTYFHPDGEQTNFTSYYNANTSDCAEHILNIANASIQRGIQENISKLEEEASHAYEEEKARRNEAEIQTNDSAILNLNRLFADDMHIGWFPYGDDIGRGVSDEVRALLFSKLSRLRIEPGDISELEKNAEKAVVVYGSTTDNSKSLSVIIFGNQIVINSKESKDQCFKTDDEFLYEDVMALLTGDGKENLLAPFYPPAEAVYEYSGISEKAIPLETLNEIAQEINNYKWYPVSTYGSTQDALHIKVSFKNEIQDKTLHIYLKDDYISIAENDNNAQAEQQKLMNNYCCYHKDFTDVLKTLLEK